MARAHTLTFSLLFWLATTPPGSAQRAQPAPPLSATVPLAHVLALADAYPNLRQEIRLALIRAGASKEAAKCSAAALGPDWIKLAGQPLGPYRCRIGAATLYVTATAIVFDAARHKLAPTDPRRPARAATLVEQRLVWRWQ